MTTKKNTTKKKALVICPGRGSYTAEQLGYFHKNHADNNVLREFIDKKRSTLEKMTLTELDQAKVFSRKTHVPGENSSVLIYGCGMADYQAINSDLFDVVAITGNSMGWYTALACAGALEQGAAFDVVDTMGSMMKENIIGGQMIYPVVGEDWKISPKRLSLVNEVLATINKTQTARAYVSIHFGGYVVFGANEEGLKLLKKS